MGTRRWADIKNSRKISPEHRAELDREVQEELLQMSLREVREAAGLSQAEVAEATDIAQSQLSRLESREDHKTSTLRRYVEALGGELEIVAVMGNKRITIIGA